MNPPQNSANTKLTFVGITAVVIFIAWLLWAWQDNQQLLTKAEAQFKDGDYHQAQQTLDSMHGGIVPLDSDLVDELAVRIRNGMAEAAEADEEAAAEAAAALEAVALATVKAEAEAAQLAAEEAAENTEDVANAEATPEVNVEATADVTPDVTPDPEAVPEVLTNPLPEQAEVDHLAAAENTDVASDVAANEHALAHGRVLVLVDPLPWVEALQDPNPEQVAEGQALLARHRFGTDLKAQWPTPAFPKPLHLQLLNLELPEAELVSAFNQHLLAHGWATIVTDPAPVVKALRNPSPAQRAEGALLTARHKISAALLPRWIEPTLSKPVLDMLRTQELTPVQIEAEFLRLAQTTMSQKVDQLAAGPWVKATDSASAKGALATATGLLEQLPKPGLTEAEVADVTKRIGVIQAEANAAAKSRGAVEAKLAAEILAKENAERNPFDDQGWIVVDRTVGHGGFAKKLMDPNTGITFVLIAPGEFQMGSPAAELEREADEIQFTAKIEKAFYLGMTEVTQAQWRKVMTTNRFPSHFEGSKLPVDSVSWDDCQEFLAAAGAGYRLPSEQEWEYACRAGTTTPFSVGPVITNAQANLDGRVRYGEGGISDALIKTSVVGSLPANPWGLHDMHGNVWEWCSDWYSIDASSPADSGTERVLRGGSWINTPRYCRSANRFMQTPATRNYVNGFRVVIDLP